MQVIEIKPSNTISFKLPYQLTSKFTIGNLTLRTVCIYIVTLHPHAISVDNKCFFIDAFQQAQVCVILHWGQEINNLFKSKIRVYIWELYDEQSLQVVTGKMFNKQTDGNCLLFQQLTITVDIDSKYLQSICNTLPHIYQISKISLPNSNSANITQQMLNRVLNHCQKLGKVKAIYNYKQHQYIVQFGQLQDIVGSFCQVRDNADSLVIFGIGCVTSLGSVVCSPDLLYLNNNIKSTSKVGDSGKSGSKKEVTKMSFVLHENQMKKPQQINAKFQQNQFDYNSPPQIEQQNKIQISKFQIIPEKQKSSQNVNVHENNPFQKQQFRMQNNQKSKNLVKQSFFVAPQKTRFGVIRKRTKSQQNISLTNDEQQFSSTSIDIQVLNQWRNARTFETKSIKQFQQKCLDFNKKILNFNISFDQKYIYLLLRDCIIICEVQNFANKRIIKFDAIDVENVHLPTPMILFNKQTMMIFANQSYLFWVSLTGEQQADWKYVQRKQIYSIQVIQQLNLLMVGGKNFSKLSYLGKSTQRSNIKVYSCGKTGKRDHLFTYDIPNCNGQNVMQMKYITTKPNGTKLLLTLTNHNKLFFLRVRAFNHIQVYSCIQTQEIGIQQIVSMNYYIDSSILIILQKLSQQFMCFKYLKTNCSYQKVQIATQSVKLPVTKYSSNFRIGGVTGHQWITAVDSKNCIYSLYLDWKQHQKSEYNSALKDCLLLKKGAIFRQNTQIRCRLLK